MNMDAQLWLYILIVASSNVLTFVTGNACDDKLNELTNNNGSSSSLSEACTAPDGTTTCPSACEEKVNEILTACENQVFDFSLLGETIRCYDSNVCQAVTSGVYSAYSFLCPDDGSSLECEKPCVDIMNALENACLEPDGYIPPEYFLDTQFGHPNCKQIAFSNAIDRSGGDCGGWADNHPVRFGDVCSNECTDTCVDIVDKMFGQCEDAPSFEELAQNYADNDFFVEDFRNAFNGVCQAAFIANNITREIDNLASYNCQEMVEFYGKASEYLCPAETRPLTVVGNNGVPESAFPLGLCQGGKKVAFTDTYYAS